METVADLQRAFGKLFSKVDFVGDDEDDVRVTKVLLQVSRFCESLFSLLFSLESDLRRRFEAASARLEGLTRTLEEGTRRWKALNGRLQSWNEELNKELTQVMRENSHLRRELDTLDQRLHRDKAASVVAFGPTILEEDEEAANREEAENEELLSSLRRSSSADPDDDGDDASCRLALLRQRCAARELRKELVALKKKKQELTREVVKRDCEVVVAQGQISALQEELDVQKEECYGHLKAMQQLKCQQRSSTSSPPPVVSKRREGDEDYRGLQLELVEAKRQLAKAKGELRDVMLSKDTQGV